MSDDKTYQAEPFLSSEADELTGYLMDLYQGVFEREAVQAHLENHVGYAFADYACQVVQMYLQPGARLLDIGSGFGSFVTAARFVGFDARGIEIAGSEVDFARRRLARVRPDDDAEHVFVKGDATRSDLGNGELDAVTFWNVLEHIEDSRTILASAAGLLKPGGLAFIICPNYNASRLEAHYHIPWEPYLRNDRNVAAQYIRDAGRNPAYFESSIFCRTNWEVLRDLRQLGFQAMELGTHFPLLSWLPHIGNCLRHPKQAIRFFNPRKESVTIVARKR